MSKKNSVDKLYTINSHRVQVLMVERRLKLRHLAQRLGVTISAVGHVINNRRPSSVLREKLAKVLGVKLTEILDTSKIVQLKPKGRRVAAVPTSEGGNDSLSSLAASTGFADRS